MSRNVKRGFLGNKDIKANARTRRTGAVLLTVVVGVTAAYWLFGRPSAVSATQVPSLAASAKAAGGLFATGSATTYDLHWKGSSAVQLPGAQQSVNVDVELEGTLLARAIEERVDQVDVLVSIPTIRTYDIRMSGRAMFDDSTAPAEKSALTNAAVLVTMDRRGPIRALRFDPKTPKGVRSVLERVVEAMRITLPAKGEGGAAMAVTWDAEEPTPTGLSQVRYSREPGGALHRERVAYTRITALPSEGELETAPQHIEGGATIVLMQSGALDKIDDTESVTLEDPEQPFHSSSSFHLARTGEEPFDPKGIDAAAFSDKGNGRDPRTSDEAVVGQMTGDAIGTMVVDYGHGAALPRGFMVRASAYARLHPEASSGVRALFSAPGANNRGRTLVVDILSATGDAAAQEALSALLSSREALADENAWSQWVQRSMLVARPSRAFAEVVLGLYEQAKKDDRRAVANAAAVPLGALAKKLGAQGEKELGAKLHHELLSDLAAATRDDDRIALLKGLGNGAFEGDDAVIAPYAKHENAHVREQVAWSLRNIDTKLARETQVALVSDKNRNIAETAVRSMRRQTLSQADWDRLAADVASGTMPDNVDSAMVTLLRNTSTDPGPAMKKILETIKARTNHNPDLHDEIQGMLTQLAENDEEPAR